MLVARGLAAAVSAAAAPSAQRSGSVPLRVKVGGLRLGGMPSEKARAAIAYAYNRPLRFVFYGKRWRVRPAALGTSLDLRGTMKAALNAKAGQNVPLQVKSDSGRVAQYARWLESWLSVEPQNATATLTSRLTPVLHAGKPGLQVRAGRTALKLEAALRTANRTLLRPSAKTVPAAMTRAASACTARLTTPRSATRPRTAASGCTSRTRNGSSTRSASGPRSSSCRPRREQLSLGERPTRPPLHGAKGWRRIAAGAGL